MPTPGYIYALINPSLEGLVKVGKTTGTPELRAKELSAATGVPAPFIVAFEVYTEDCDKAETFVHTALELKGYRLSDNKEFFRAPLKEVVRLMSEVPSSTSSPIRLHKSSQTV